jgi:hypothetical protein
LLFFAVGKVRIPDKIQSLVGKKATLPEHFRISEFRDARGFASIKPLQQVNDTDVSTSCAVARRHREEHFLLGQDIPVGAASPAGSSYRWNKFEGHVLGTMELGQLRDNPVKSVSMRAADRATLHCGNVNV